MPKRRLLVYLILPFLLLLGMACGPCGLLSRGVPTPPRPIAVSTEAAGQLESRIQQNLDGPPGQEFILHMTDAEATSLAATELAKYDEAPLREPTIWFTQGKVYATGRMSNVLPVETDFYLVAAPRVEDGKLVIEIEEVSAGAMPLPDSFLEIISQSISETLDELHLDVQITALEVREGEIVIKGVRR